MRQGWAGAIGTLSGSASGEEVHTTAWRNDNKSLMSLLASADGGTHRKEEQARKCKEDGICRVQVSGLGVSYWGKEYWMETVCTYLTGSSFQAL